MPNSNTYRHVQGLTRGLAVLCELNKLSSGVASAVELARATGLHRSTVKRLLETLSATGFVHPAEDGNHYRLSFRVQQLSAGFRDETGACTAAAPALRRLTQKILWPSDLVTREEERMVIRFSTHSFSPLSFHPGTVGDHTPLLPTATGRAYLAFCPDDERELLLEMMALRDDRYGEMARDTRTLRRVLQTTRERGFGANDGEWTRQPGFGALAAPVLHQGRVVACFNVIFSLKALSMALAIKRYGADVLATAREIESSFAAARTVGVPS
ncbi:DNA-binding transcriptional regulator [Ramlibacter albus]|uniref:DNA-binding transcriptional regulator n=1 Tax=Ramlibacter albus TaxID=2079448 RepID=A0A923M5G4_9BURK|nr:DNA-binding transcriptional regulator [Ramlibacter albus]MBC5763019.1 DNA-binding transcriptional regulator [Ramlibacter albus]